MRLMIFGASILIGVLLTIAPAYNAGFTSDALGQWLVNATFVAALVGWAGMKFFYKKD